MENLIAEINSVDRLFYLALAASLFWMIKAGVAYYWDRAKARAEKNDERDDYMPKLVVALERLSENQEKTSETLESVASRIEKHEAREEVIFSALLKSINGRTDLEDETLRILRSSDGRQ